MIFKKDEDPIISFVSMLDGLHEIDGVSPYPAIHGIPEWWRPLPRSVPVFGEMDEIFTVKACPSFVDYFSQGFILPAWEDVTLKYDEEKDFWIANTRAGSRQDYFWDIHGNQQFLSHVDVKVNNLKPTLVFKGNSPWKIITKPGWSVLQVPLFYHFDNDFIALPGIIDTDLIHDANVQLLYFGNGKEVNIKRGQPLVQYIPFKREKHSVDIRYRTDKDIQKINKGDAIIRSKHMGAGAYRIAQKRRDHKEIK